MSYTTINTVTGTVSDIKLRGFKLVANLKLGDTLYIGVDAQEGNDDDGYRERNAIIAAIVPDGNKGVYISFVGVYSENSIELKLNQYIKVVK